MTKQTARKWTFKGTSASLAVAMAFGMIPATATMAMAEESQPAPIVREIMADNSAEEGAASILSAAASYSYDDGYSYGTSATVVNADGTSIVSYYGADAIGAVGDDMARYLGALHRAQGAGVGEIVYDGTTYVWNEAAGLKGSNWVKQGTTDEQLTTAKEEGKLSDYTLVGAIAAKMSAESGAAAESQAAQAANLSLELKKDGASYNVSLGATVGDASDAVSNAAASSSVILNKDWTLDEAVSIEKNLTIDGNGHTITGKSDDASVCFNVASGTFAISNAKLSGFGDTAASVTGAGVFKVPDTADAGSVKIVADGVTVEKFNRAAFDVRQGSFEIADSTIDCDNGQEKALTKGVVAGYADSSSVTGSISNVAITGADSDYEGWSASGIEVSAGATVDVQNVKIDNAKGGISVARNYGAGEAKVTVGGADTSINARDYALRVYDGSTTVPGNGEAAASLTVDGGSYSGDVRIGVGTGFDATGKSSISIKSGSFNGIAEGSVEDFKAFVASGSVLSGTAEEGFTVAESQSGGGTGGGTENPGGGESVTNPDGSVTTTVEGEDGSSTETTVSKDEAVTTVVEKDASGNVTSIEATVAGDEAPAGTVALPMAKPLEPASSEKAPAISVKAPAGTKVSVPVAAAEGSKEPAPGAVLAVVDAEGGVTVLPKTASLEGALAAEIPGDCTLKVVDASVDFPDVEAGDWFSSAADFASARGILAGSVDASGEAVFDASGEVTRGMFVTMLNRVESRPSASEGFEGFGDVAEGSWYGQSSAWGAEQGIVEGVSDGSFDGDSGVTREQMALFMMRYAKWLGLDVSARSDAETGASEWAADAMSWAVAEGLLVGDGQGYNAQGGATRAEAATVVMRFVNMLY